MKAAVVSTVGGPFVVEDLVIDTPMPHEVLVDVRAVGLCHSDLTFAENDYGTPLPMVLGHEFAGIVSAVGSSVSGIAVGDSVVGSLVRSCGRCAVCASGASYQCSRRGELLRRKDDPPRLRRDDGTPVTAALGTAAFAEQCLVHENQLVKIPDELPFTQAALLGCATITGAGAVLNAARVRPGESVAVIGLGGVGLNAVAAARLAGADPVIAIDRSAEKLDLAKRFGASHVVDATQEDSVKAVRTITARAGVRHAFEMVGIEATTLQAIKMTGTGGGAYLVGMHRPDSSIQLNVTDDLLMYQRSVTGVYMGSSNIKADIPVFAAMAVSGRLPLGDLISSEISLSQIGKGFEDMRAGAGMRTVITSWD
ncbi:Zn-dependent alcohol dehydrogenase [Rhodococcus opacus]|uniref:Zn-dependent alcohol dehydrogenase n=1 Tax=Rhodococcus opacus TaxID=37919 RepID=UPI001C488D67|nr:Zn-dependent alcohol dehydrogenase [Rhodococcus opacus]MBV6756670.1 Zn-dependent alcohol dehydrogenase [Rhodococcus opacus]